MLFEYYIYVPQGVLITKVVSTNSDPAEDSRCMICDYGYNVPSKVVISLQPPLSVLFIYLFLWRSW